MNNTLTFIDLFAGAGGLSEGFVRAGFRPVAHVEADASACATLTTRRVFQHLKETKTESKYLDYLQGIIGREKFWDELPPNLRQSVIHEKISRHSIRRIYSQIDKQLDGNQVDLIIGGPPCQAYSLIGRSRDPNRMVGDTRNYLFQFYACFLRRYKPRFFVFENVLGLLTAGNQIYLNKMLKLFRKAGYSTDFKVLNSEDFGVLQKRRRVIVIGQRDEPQFEFPTLETTDTNWQVKDALLSDLPRLEPGQELTISKYTKPCNEYLKASEIRNGLQFTSQHIARPHNSRDLEIYSIAISRWLEGRSRLKYDELPERLRTHKNIDGFLDRFKVVNPFGHSHTVVAHIAKDGHYYIYPDSDQVRSISVREAARIQSFPDDFYFEGGRTAAYRQIGNAVPPLMAQAIAKWIKKQFDEASNYDSLLKSR